MILRSVAILLASLVVTTGAAEEKWWPSQWGADDELGAFNMLGSELTLKAAKLIKTGKTYRLGIETNHDTPAYPPRTFDLNVLMPNQYNSTSYGNNKFSYADDIIAGWLGIGSQIDGLGHVATDGVFYNGKHGKDFIKADGLTMFGLESLPPIVSRGVMLDMAACMGHQMLSEGTAFNRAEIVACEKQQGVTIEKGDVVLFNTGWMNIIGSEPARFIDKEPGLGVDGAHYLAEKEVIAVGADTWGVEVVPPEDPEAIFPVHQITLNYNGIYLFENMDTRELAKDKAYEFMFVLGPARVSGTVQMIINPIAIR